MVTLARAMTMADGRTIGFALQLASTTTELKERFRIAVGIDPR